MVRINLQTTYNHSTRFRMGILIARQKRGECWIMVSIAGATFKGAPSWEKEPGAILGIKYSTSEKNQYSMIEVLSKISSILYFIIPVNPPPFRGSLPRKSLISRMDWVSCAGDINLPHTPFPPARSPPNKKIKYNKILTYILRSIFLEIPHLEHAERYE